jgi:hypothetical protein
MNGRCTNPNNPRYEYYGGRGIAVCDRWRGSFENFLADVGERPPGLTLERIDNNKGYEPGNVKWASWAEQALNKRRIGTQKLTHADVLAIRTDPRTQNEIATAYVVSQSLVSAIKTRQVWKHL